MMDLTINIPTIISAAVLAAGGVAAWVTLRLKVTLLESSNAKLGADLAAARDCIEDVRAKSAKELDAFKLEVAQRYATSDLMREIEERMIEAINRLGDRFDRYFDRPATRPRQRGE